MRGQSRAIAADRADLLATDVALVGSHKVCQTAPRCVLKASITVAFLIEF